MFSASSLAAYQATVPRYFSDEEWGEVEIYRASSATADGYGSPNANAGSFSLVATTKGRLSPSPYLASEREAGGVRVAERRSILEVPAGTDLRLTDEVVVGGVRYEVTAYLGRTEELLASYQVRTRD